MTPADDRGLAATVARWLAAVRAVAGALGLAAAAAALLLLVLRAPWPVCAVAALLLAPAERLLALRVHFDAGVFADIARGTTTPASFDGALAVLGLRRAPPAPRPLAARVRGAHRLACGHAALAGLQFVLVAVPAGAAAWLRP